MLLADAKTIRFRDKDLKKGGIWKVIYGIDQKQVTNMVRKDQVHILVELTGHTGNNKLRMMACRLALGIFHSSVCILFSFVFLAYIFSLVFLFIFQSLFGFFFLVKMQISILFHMLVY
jgi:hypothetical protein